MSKKPFVALTGGRLYPASGFNSFHSLSVQCSNTDDFAVFRELLYPGAVYFDVGANLGVTTFLAARAASPIRIVAFEPTAECAEAWKLNVRENQIENAILFECALSERPGELEFVSNPSAPVYNRLNLGGTRARHQEKERARTAFARIPATTIDDVCEHLGISRISLLKIDVEGAEPLVLRGARGMLERRAIEAIFLEFVPAYMLDMGESIDAFIETMGTLDYLPFDIRPDGTVGDLIPKPKLIAGEFPGPNIIFKAKA